MAKINLMYHDVYIRDVNESGFNRERDLMYKMDVVTFESHVKNIHNLCRQKSLPLENIVFTFDDGGKSFLDVIAPILDKYGFKGLFFISTKYIGTDTFLNKADIVELHKSGHIIGSHAHSHEHFYTLSDNQIDEEWKISIMTLSEIIGCDVTYASVPNGDASQHVIRSAYEHGINYLYTSEPTIKISHYVDMSIYGRYVLLNNSSSEYVMSILDSKRVRFQLLFKRKLLQIVKNLLGNNYIRLKNLIFR
jgi:peptidoglycan/xylan/chitin deacetylase (PgdA/CDA1 family)